MQDTTQLLVAWGKGDQQAFECLTPRVQQELHRVAMYYMAGERRGHMLQATALVNEAYMKLIGWKGVEWTGKQHFFGVAAGLMRRVLVDYARSGGRAKRGANTARVPLADAGELAFPAGAGVVAVDDAMKDLERLAPRQSKIVELRYFGGLSLEEIAAAIEVSVATVRRDFSIAKAWLFRELSRKSMV